MVRHDCIRVGLLFLPYDAELGFQEVVLACNENEVESLMSICFREFHAFQMLRNDEAWTCILCWQDEIFLYLLHSCW